MRKGTSIVRNARFQDSIAARLGWGRDGDWIPSPLGVGSSIPPPPLRLRGRPFGHGRYLVDSGPGVGYFCGVGVFMAIRGGFFGMGGVESTRRVTDQDMTRSSV